MNKFKLLNIKELDGFTVGKEYPLLGCAGEWIQTIDDNNEKIHVFEGYFELIEK